MSFGSVFDLAKLIEGLRGGAKFSITNRADRLFEKGIT